MNIIRVSLSLPEKGADKYAYINLNNVCSIHRLSQSTRIVFIGGWVLLVDDTPEEIGAKMVL